MYGNCIFGALTENVAGCGGSSAGLKSIIQSKLWQRIQTRPQRKFIAEMMCGRLFNKQIDCHDGRCTSNRDSSSHLKQVTRINALNNILVHVIDR